MVLAPDVRVDLTPLPELVGEVPFGQLLAAMQRAHFAPAACRAVLEDANASLRTPLLRPQGVDDGGLLVDAQVLFPREGPWRFMLEQGERRWSTRLAPEDVPLVADFLRALAAATTPAEVREAWPFDAESWSDGLVRAEPPAARWPEPEGPGLFRREHASLLVRSRSASVLVDPISLQRRLPQVGQTPGNLPAQGVDALAVTHGHVDHWHLPSLLLHLPRPELPVLVPQVPRTSLLTLQDFARALGTCGQRALAPAWGQTLEVGDLQVDVLPFYGEQPCAEGPRLAEGLRSWGNCYRFTTPDFSCLVLVDSGVDPDGSMEEVVARSCAERGPVDVVLACQREFLSPFFGGLSHYWAALPFAQLRALAEELRAGRLRSVTAGTDGVAALCARARARYFLPYANGFEGVGRPITDVGWGLGEPSEAECNRALREALAHRGAPTRVLDWCPGGAARFERGQLSLTPG